MRVWGTPRMTAVAGPFLHCTAVEVVMCAEQGAGVCVQSLRTFCDSKEFNVFIFAVIIIAGISVGIQTDPDLSNNPGDPFFTRCIRPISIMCIGLVIVDNVILFIFLGEAILKICAQCPKPVSWPLNFAVFPPLNILLCSGDTFWTHGMCSTSLL